MESLSVNHPPVAIVGGGIAGISAAFHLSQWGIPTVLFERSNQLGGRIRSSFDDEFGAELDLGVHIIAGAYTEFLRLLRGFGTDGDLHWIRPLHLPFKAVDTPTYHLHFRRLPGILGPLTGLLTYRALSFSERLRLASQLLRLASRKNIPAISAETWLSRIGATPMQASRFWDPLILATLNSLPNQIGLSSLHQIVKRGLSQSGGFALGIPLKSWQSIVGDAAQSYLVKHGVEVRLNSKVRQIIIEGGQARGLLVNGEQAPVSRVILAVSPWDWKHILTPELFELLLDRAWLSPPSSAVHSVHSLFETEEPLTTAPMLGLWGTVNQWAFAQRLESHRPLWRVSTVMSASNGLLTQPENQIISMTIRELHALWPDFRCEPSKVRCVRIRHATCPFDADFEKRRPSHKTRITGLFLAGDASATGLPATLESAAQSGLLAAQTLWEEGRKSRDA
jgi:squalene-associated FAD-dependent desaturase